MLTLRAYFNKVKEALHKILDDYHFRWIVLAGIQAPVNSSEDFPDPDTLLCMMTPEEAVAGFRYLLRDEQESQANQLLMLREKNLMVPVKDQLVICRMPEYPPEAFEGGHIKLEAAVPMARNLHNVLSHAKNLYETMNFTKQVKTKRWPVVGCAGGLRMQNGSKISDHLRPGKYPTEPHTHFNIPCYLKHLEEPELDQTSRDVAKQEVKNGKNP